MRRPYHYGFRTYEKAEAALESALASGEISEASRPQVECYQPQTEPGKAAPRRYMITLEEG
jgi:hypothetical protein